MNLKQELKKRSIEYKEFSDGIEYTPQGLTKAVGTDIRPKPVSKIIQLAFKAWLCERAGIKLEKLI